MPNTPTQFWTWLAANSDRVQAGLKRSSARMAEEVGEQFEKSYPGLVWEVTPADKGPWLFCVSANGDRKLFPRVQSAVADAPPIDGWTVQAFRPRGDPNAEISMNGQTLGPDDVWCEVQRATHGRVNLVLHLRGVIEETHRRVRLGHEDRRLRLGVDGGEAEEERALLPAA
jgi:hypothetical protein